MRRPVCDPVPPQNDPQVTKSVVFHRARLDGETAGGGLRPMTRRAAETRDPTAFRDSKKRFSRPEDLVFAAKSGAPLFDGGAE
jgi:hypothetical protein